MKTSPFEPSTISPIIKLENMWYINPRGRGVQKDTQTNNEVEVSAEADNNSQD